MMTAVRLCRSLYSPKDATGARLHGGRWNSPGHEMLYASSTLALACLEVLVHIRDVGLMPTDYVYCEVEVPEDLVSPWNLMGEEALGKIESPVLSREFGDRWITKTIADASNLYEDYLRSLSPKEREVMSKVEWAIATPVQTVPSVIIPREMNYLISPVHPQFQQLAWGDPQPFRFDPRLIRSTAE
jgi:RES domain-containing protein